MSKYKQFPIILLSLAIMAIGSKVITQQVSNDEIDITDEKSAIMQVIEDESAAFWNKDFDAYAACWVQESYVRTMGWWQDGGVTVIEGWEAHATSIKKLMADNPEPNPTATQVRRENINLRVFKEVAWLTFDQFGADTGDKRMDMPGLSRETRILEKHNGKWKIAYVGWLLVGE